jgi:hypothetical protein
MTAGKTELVYKTSYEVQPPSQPSQRKARLHAAAAHRQTRDTLRSISYPGRRGANGKTTLKRINGTARKGRLTVTRGISL